MTEHPERPEPPGSTSPAGDGQASTQQLPTQPTQQLPAHPVVPAGSGAASPAAASSGAASAVTEPAYQPPAGLGYGSGYGPPPSGPPYLPAGAAVPAGMPAGPVSEPPRQRRGAGIVVLAAVVGLIAGLIGGAVAFVGVERVRGVPTVSTIPSPVAGTTSRPQGSIAQIAAGALPSVVTIRIRGSSGTGTGSGFVIDSSGHVLTNNHVVASVASSGSITLDLSDGTTLNASIVGRDASYDLAVLKADRTDLPALSFGRSADVVVGDGVIAVGAPLGLEATVTSGIVSAVDRPVATAGGGDETSYMNAIQTDAAINPGNSGGPLLDMSGHVIGVNSAIARAPGSTSDTGGNIGVGFAIPSDQAYKTAQQLINTGKAVHPVIGVSLDRRYDGSGAKIAEQGGVTSGSAAAAAGLRDGDVIVGFEGRTITDPNQLVVAIRARSVGDTVRLKVERDGQTLEMNLTLQSAS